MYKGYHIAGSLALFASTQLSSQKLDMTDKKFYKDIITLVEEWGQSLKRVTTSVTSPPTSTSTSISSSSIHTSHLTSNSTISIINPPNSLSLAESDQSAPTIPSSLITRASRKSKSPSTSSNPPSNSKPNLPASDPSKKYSHRYREFNTRLLTILEKYRTKTNSPGLTAAIHFNPESEKYIPSSTVFDIDYEEGESDRQGKLINTIIDVNKGCICGDITCSCSDNSDNLDNSSSTSLSSFSHCAPCTLSSLEKPIQTHGFIAWAGAVGLSDIELGVPIRSSTKMKVASISKVITAMLCARFVETGLLNVDTPITTYLNYDWDDISGRLFSDYKNEKIRSINPIGVHDQGVGMNPDAKSIPHSATFQHAASRPYTLTAMQKAVQSSSNSTFDSNSSSNLSSRIDIPRHFDTITTRQLLAHTSGVRGYLGDEFLSSLTYPTTASSLMPILQDDLLHPPGEKFSYTTHGYSFIASVLESIVKNAANSPHDSADNNAISNLSNTTPPTWYKDSQDRKVVKQGDIYKYLLSPLQIKNTIPIPPSTIPVLDRSKQYTRELHTSLPSEVINTFESLSGIVNESEVAKYTLVRVNGNGIYHGNLQYITGTNPCGLPQPVYNSPFTDNSNKYAGAGFLANATDLALLGGALTGLDPAIKSNILDSFWTSQKVPRHAKKAKGEGIEIEMKNTGYGLGFTILPTGNVNVVKTISNNGNVDIVDTTVAAVTQNTQGQLIIDDVTTTTTSTTTKQGPWWYGRAVGHSGQAIDGSSYILIMPEEGITVSVLSNIDRCNLKPLAFEIAKEFEQFIQ